MTPDRSGRRRRSRTTRTWASAPLASARRRRRRRSRISRRRAILLAAILPIVVVLLLAGGLTGAVALGSDCDLSALRPVAIGQNSFVYAADGSLLGSIPAERNRQPVSFGNTGTWAPRATIAIEDRRFHEHSGIDVEGIARALWEDIKAGKVVQGGSTITQQLVRNLYITQERTFSRKVKEACLAAKLDRAWSKDRILAGYLNQVYYGNHAYGIEAAAQTYFSKHARRLTLPEAALLAGLTQAPSVFDPFKRPERALARRGEVLTAMLQSGAITDRKYQAATASPLGLRPGELYTRIREPYFFGYVRDELIDEYGAATVRSGGLRVYTTVDPRFQRLARQGIRDTLYLPTDPAAAVVSINPANGAIRAMVAVTPGRKRNQFNLASQARRQAGSTFKTFVLTAAVDKGINPATSSYVSAPFRYQPSAAAEPWDVSTYSHGYYGWSSIESATLRSDNTVYAQLTLDVTAEGVASMAHRLGIQGQLPLVPSLGLGAGEVSPLEMASAYATIAAGGIYSRPMAIRKVVLPNGKVDTGAPWGRIERKRVITDGVAWEVTRILEKNMLYGTGTGAYFGRPAAGKTGTTDDHADAWFAGYTPNLQTTVWVGYPQGKIPMESVHGISVAGGTFPAEIWRRFMQRALAYSPPVEWQEPRVYPEWKPFVRGPHALVFYDDGSDDEEDEKKEDEKKRKKKDEAATETQGAEPEPAQEPVPADEPEPEPVDTAPAPPPVETEPPPVETKPPPTEEPPPPVETEPPPVETEPPPPPPPTTTEGTPTP